MLSKKHKHVVDMQCGRTSATEGIKYLKYQKYNE